MPTPERCATYSLIVRRQVDRDVENGGCLQAKSWLRELTAIVAGRHSRKRGTERRALDKRLPYRARSKFIEKRNRPKGPIAELKFASGGTTFGHRGCQKELAVEKLSPISVRIWEWKVKAPQGAISR